ncbi:ATP-grasp domain-containing protein [Kitasatospora sp. NPDC127111]|uniref:carboxylate--amine ligase n=1 Tax=Kitasatospora sp. NPDC127111 TaxID=3345363 RepID=UPI00363272AF
MARARTDPDGAVPALVVKIGRYPQEHVSLGVTRSLGRLGVPVHAMVEDRFTPSAVSRYLTGRLVLPTTGFEDQEELVAALLRIGRTIGRRSVAVAVGDEAAVLLAEHADRLAPYFLLPPVPSGLPRRLASKQELERICRRYGVRTPRTCTPGDRDELLAQARWLGYPLVLKNREAWTRLRAPVVHHTTVVRDQRELLASCPSGGSPSVVLQEYIPAESAEDWFTQLYCDTAGVPRLVFTGHKLRSWPPGAGAASRASALPNPVVADLAAGLCRSIGYTGIADLDWRFDHRDGHYKLVDFNPRVGSQFRLFETVQGLDVVRALYLDLTGGHLPDGPQRHGRTFVLGQLDVPSAAVTAWRLRRLPPAVLPRPGLERAWFSRDDPAPAAALAVRFAGTVTKRLARPLTRPLARSLARSLSDSRADSADAAGDSAAGSGTAAGSGSADDPFRPGPDSRAGRRTE